MRTIKKVVGLGVALVATAILAACGTAAADEATEHVRLGVVGTNYETWAFVRDYLADEGIDLEIVSFSDFVQPNQALVNGDIDLNAFQTQIFLDGFNEANGENLTPIGLTFLAPLGIYSLEIEDVSSIQEGDQIAIPNDVTNGGRALNLLQTAGLLTIREGAGLLPSVEDIVENPLNLDIVELDAAQTALALQDVRASVINNGMAFEAGFVPSQDAIFLEPVSDESFPYFNIVAARPEEIDNPVFQRIVERFQTDEIIQIAYELNQGSSIPVWLE